MTTKLENKKSLETKYGVRYTASFPINLPVEKIDLYKWVTEMSDTDYKSYSKSHLAMSSFFENGMFYSVNVENIGNETLVQKYELRYHEPSHVQFYSQATKAYVMRWFPAVVGVPWELQVRSTSAKTSELICLIGADFPSRFLQIAAYLNGLFGYFLNNHLKKEGKAFAKDLENKFNN